MRPWLIRLLLLLLVANPVLAATVNCGHQPSSVTPQIHQHRAPTHDACTYHQQAQGKQQTSNINDCNCSHCHGAPVLPNVVLLTETPSTPSLIASHLPLLPLPERIDAPYRPPILLA